MNGHPQRFAARMVLGIATATFAACGGAPLQAPEAPAASSPAEAASEPVTTANAEETLALFERAEGELDSALGRQAFTPPAAPLVNAPSPTTVAPAPVAPADTPPAQPTSPSKKTDDSVSGSGVPVDPCDTACRALVSMERAAEHLCGLAGDSDPRCGGARTRVKGASERVAARCPRCSAR